MFLGAAVKTPTRSEGLGRRAMLDSPGERERAGAGV